MTDVHFGAIGIVVADMDAAITFYRMLGLEFAGDEGHFEAALPGGLRLMFDTEEIMRRFDPSFESPPAPGRIGLAFECGSPEAVDTTFAAIAAAGNQIHLEPFDAFWGQRYATVIDPDGNHIDLYATL
jgi:catechol 2,3-dioxygenase-like lactoylglutathione lyase family enzyme